MKPKQECHEGRRRLHSRALLGSLVLASAGLSACGDDQGVDSADLQAILHDGDLTEIMRSMLVPPPAQAWRAPAAAPAARRARPGTLARARPADGGGTGPGHRRGHDRLGRDGRAGTGGRRDRPRGHGHGGTGVGRDRHGPAPDP